ncbi:hypothetical protein Hypma_004554 [Hypsizygus marmoreus]|uniref:Uncharacterized protein n=1 Tax=Hypsizygus marmoreus TaxID=39966 RepID=A0A369J1X8_HYPMA|nr:hypothetical protein Hypma_004554 [Hypsizygus marmoreus]
MHGIDFYIWQNIQSLEHYNNITAPSLRVRSIILIAFWVPHAWIHNLVDFSLTHDCWATNFIFDVADLHQAISGARMDHVEFDLARYLPAQGSSNIVTYQLPRSQHNDLVIADQILACIYYVIKRWLGFPLDSKSTLQAQVMAEFVKANSIPSILLLDGMWTLFNDPVGTLIGTNGKWAKTVKDTMVIQTLSSLIARHPFWKQDTSAYQVLCLLNDQRIAWDAVHANALDHRITSSHSPIQHLPLQLSYDTKKTLMKAFSQFLRDLLPVVKDGPLAHVNSTKKKRQKVAKKPDFYMPFRDLAPT